ncbi:MAG: HAD family hydrolase [Candidatus Micrarchaeota archaeon]
MSTLITTLVFDVDGILRNSGPAIHYFLNETLKKEVGWEIPFGEKEHLAIRGNWKEFSNIKTTLPVVFAVKKTGLNVKKILEAKNAKETLMQIYKENPTDEKTIETLYQVFMKQYTSLDNASLKAVNPIPDCFKAVQQLAKKYKLACFSDSSSKLHEAWLTYWNAKHFFQANIGIEESKAKKPDPKGLELVSAELKTKPGEMAYIGDSTIDIETARAFGCKSIAISTGFAKKSELLKNKPNFFYENLQELVNANLG